MSSPRTDPTDESLMILFQSGDRAAFTVLVRRHQGPLFNFALRYLRSSPVAEEVVQDAFVRVVQNAAEFKHEARFSTWLYTIARNLCVDHARRAVHRDAASLDGPGHGRAEPETDATLHDRIASSEPAPDAAVADRQAKARIDAAIAALPPDQREVFLMREVMEMPFAEIAAAVGASEPTVKSRMRYALEKLRASLVELGGDEAGKTESSGSG